MRLWRFGSVVLLLSVSVIKVEPANPRAQTASKYYCNGECEVDRERCSCKGGCRELRNCCSDYTESCQGGSSWTEESCTPREDMKCPQGYENTVLMLSIDGFRDIYLQRNLTPTISKLVKCGASAPYMIATYATKTFPNHYTIVTGLYPESHGIIANQMYNHDTEEEFRVGRPASYNPDWWKGEPIWVTASNAGLKSAAYFWPGSDVNITRYPDYWNQYDGNVDVEERAYTMLDWMDLDEKERPKMIVMYTSAVDSAGHSDGPYSLGVNTSLADTDKFVELIMNGLRDRKLDTCVNFIMVSDHGMASVDCSDVTHLEDYGVDVTSVYLDTGPYARIGKSRNKALWSKFNPVETKKKLECKRNETNWEAFLKYEYLPKRLHYANNPLIEDLHLMMDPEKWVDGSALTGYCSVGNHGYDPLYQDMRSLFIAHGAGFKREYQRKEPFQSIEVYNLLSDLLRISGADNNGTHGALYDMMSNSPALLKEGDGENAESCSASDSNASTLGCQGCEGQSSTEANARLKSYELRAAELEAKHMLYGRPRIFDTEARYCFLYQEEFVTTYDKVLRMPRITSFVLAKSNSWSDTPTCVRRDIRLPDTAVTKCSEYDNNDNGINWSYLFFPNLSSGNVYSDATVTSNMIPVHPNFMQIWTFMQKKMNRWANIYNGISVHAGPIFDYNYDGLADNGEIRQRNGTFVTPYGYTVVPTHFFIVMTRCKDQTSGKAITECADDIRNIEVLSFIIPNYAEEPCHEDGIEGEDWIPQALIRHVGRIKDVELLTKSSFFTKWAARETHSDGYYLEAIARKLYIPQESSSWLSDFLVDPASGARPLRVTSVIMVVITFVSWTTS